MANFYVSAHHALKSYRMINQGVSIIEDGSIPEGCYVRVTDKLRYYAAAPFHGIGDEFSSPTEAFRFLLEANGCTDVRISKAPQVPFVPVSSAKAIEAAFADVIAEHGLTTISVGYSDRDGGKGYYSAALHWDGYARSNNSCASEYSDESVAHALRKAITAMRADRMTGLLSVAVPVLEMGGVA